MPQIIKKWGYFGGCCQKSAVPGMVWGSQQIKVDPGIFRASQNLGAPSNPKNPLGAAGLGAAHLRWVGTEVNESQGNCC